MESYESKANKFFKERQQKLRDTYNMPDGQLECTLNGVPLPKEENVKEFSDRKDSEKREQQGLKLSTGSVSFAGKKFNIFFLKTDTK